MPSQLEAKPLPLLLLQSLLSRLLLALLEKSSAPKPITENAPGACEGRGRDGGMALACWGLRC